MKALYTRAEEGEFLAHDVSSFNPSLHPVENKRIYLSLNKGYAWNGKAMQTEFIDHYAPYIIYRKWDISKIQILAHPARLRSARIASKIVGREKC